MFINMCIFHVFTNWINHDKTSRHVAQVFSCPSASKRCVRFTPSPRSFQTETGCSQLELACWMVMTRNFHAYKVSTNHQISIKYDQIWIKLFFSGFLVACLVHPFPRQSNLLCSSSHPASQVTLRSRRARGMSWRQWKTSGDQDRKGSISAFLHSSRFQWCFPVGWCPCSDLMVNRCLVTRSILSLCWGMNMMSG